MNRYHTSILVAFAILLVMFEIFISGDTHLNAADYNINTDSQAYILDKFEGHNLVLLGTGHKSQPILELIFDLIPNLHDAGVTHLGLEICSDQEVRIDNFLKTADGSSGIEIHSSIDCPEYRKILARLQRVPDSIRPVVTALDLPKSKYDSLVKSRRTNFSPPYIVVHLIQ